MKTQEAKCFMQENFGITRIARNTVADMPSATVNSPRSFGRVKLLSKDDENILTHTNNHVHSMDQPVTTSVISSSSDGMIRHIKETIDTIRY